MLNSINIDFSKGGTVYFYDMLSNQGELRLIRQWLVWWIYLRKKGGGVTFQ